MPEFQNDYTVHCCLLKQGLQAVFKLIIHLPQSPSWMLVIYIPTSKHGNVIVILYSYKQWVFLVFSILAILVDIVICKLFVSEEWITESGILGGKQRPHMSDN